MLLVTKIQKRNEKWTILGDNLLSILRCFSEMFLREGLEDEDRTPARPMAIACTTVSPSIILRKTDFGGNFDLSSVWQNP